MVLCFQLILGCLLSNKSFASYIINLQKKDCKSKQKFCFLMALHCRSFSCIVSQYEQWLQVKTPRKRESRPELALKLQKTAHKVRKNVLSTLNTSYWYPLLETTLVLFSSSSATNRYITGLLISCKIWT